MELRLVFLLCWASCPLSRAPPVSGNGGGVPDIPILLTGGDVRPKLHRSAKECTNCLWTKSQDGRVRVPYVALSPAYMDFEKSMFISAMKEYEAMTCIQFVNRSTEMDYLSIENLKGCWSFVGKMGGKQTTSLSMDGCIKYNVIQHEIMHVLGFYHEFTRRDRDNYIDVMWKNIAPDLCRQKLFTPGSSTYNSTSSGQGGAYCLYLIQSILKVLLQVRDLNIPSSPGCNDSYIKVYDGVSQSSPVLLDKTCGNGSVPLLISSGSFMLIEIVNNQTSPSTFTASYQTVRYGGTYLTDNGVVTSPGFPSMYRSNLDVVYSIIASIGRKVSLTFYFFITKTSPNCSIDYLIVNDGPLKTSPILGTYCGYMVIPLSVVSTGNVMILQFHSGNSSGYNGFYAQYKFVTTAK